MKINIKEENFKWHLEAFASELFIYIYIYIYIYINQGDNSVSDGQ